MNSDEVALIVGEEMINYSVKDESFLNVFKICLKRHGDFSSRETNKILTKVIHVITTKGYDIDSLNPCRFRRFID